MKRAIVYATDFSENSQPALRYASSLAARTGAELYVVHVSEALPTPDNPNPAYRTPTSIIAAELSAKQQVEAVQPTEPGVHCIRRVLHGNPAKELVRFAKQQNAEAIIIGTHGRTGVMKLLMGSVAEAVIHEAECPVIVVKPPPDAGEADPATAPDGTE